MSFHVATFIIIIILAGYIIYLQIRLSAKNIFIETTLKNFSGIDSSNDREDILAYLKEIRELEKYGPFIKDKLTNEKSLSFIFENEKSLKIFIHYTKEEDDALNILRNGFLFSDSFYKTALPVTNDKLDLRMKHSGRRFYGDFLVVIAISSDLLNTISHDLKMAGITNYVIENFLTETPPDSNENNDFIYTLPAQFIKGYLNYNTGEIVKNEKFDPSYSSPGFHRNIEKYKKSIGNQKL